jgi:hypothetical protein
LVLGSIRWWIRRWVEFEVRVEELQNSGMNRKVGDEDASRTCCETKQFKGPTSAKMPICSEELTVSLHASQKKERKETGRELNSIRG